jgi:hypothetical protein
MGSPSLRENGHKGKLQWVSNFIEKEICANSNFLFRGLDEIGISPEAQELIREIDRISFARDLNHVLPLLMANRSKPKHCLTLLFRFLRDYIAEYCPDSYWRSPEFLGSDTRQRGRNSKIAPNSFKNSHFAFRLTMNSIPSTQE